MSSHESPKPIRLVFFGDSICVGQGVSIHRSWVCRIAAKIDELNERQRSSVLVVNASINGNTTRQALERMPYDVQSNGVDILLVQFGMNDCNYWLSDKGGARVSLKAFEANLEEIIERGIRFGAKHVLLNTNHPTLRTKETFPGTSITYEDSNKAYNEVIRRVASAAGGKVVLNDVGPRFDAYTEGNPSRLSDLLLEDGLHLSVKGHDIYFDLIYPKIMNIVSDCRVDA
ncbi:SGNH/GDSL hydrolase family protein [Caenispirillum bisanense]|uniref:SGNH/GDSL hydrolase family protein n=1 Tax=Caenispirillum bisanense TaxID=414052 RepID=UPI0031E3BA63